MAAKDEDPFGSRRQLDLGADGTFSYFSLPALRDAGVVKQLERMPISIRLLLESALHQCGSEGIAEHDVARIAEWSPVGDQLEIPFKPARVILQDTAGAAALVDLAGMRAAIAARGGDPSAVNPVIGVDMVVDHSLQVDHSGTSDAAEKNEAIELSRNLERFRFIRWAQESLRNFRVMPPGVGIIHQVNLERLTSCAAVSRRGADSVAHWDSVIGSDSHTPMINALGVLGWGVGGIEAEAAMLGQPLPMALPRVVGVRLEGRPSRGVTTTDVVLTLTQVLRKHRVVDAFVEFFGPGVATLSVPQRATLSNMAPEYGSTVALFPFDAECVRFLSLTGRAPATIRLAERYAHEQGLLWTPDFPLPEFSSVVTFDLSQVEPSVAGPSRPHDRVSLPGLRRAGTAPKRGELGDESVVIAAITSCTNTSNPSVMLAAGLVARNAARRGMRVPSFVKTSMAPGSRAVVEYLRRADMVAPLEALGFHVVGFGCTTCIGASGPLLPGVEEEVGARGLKVAAVLSGNRNFEVRIHPSVVSNYLASPPLVVAFALAGTTNIDLTTEPIGADSSGQPVFLEELWPSDEEIQALRDAHITRDVFEVVYGNPSEGSDGWRRITSDASALFSFEPGSTYVAAPPYFDAIDSPATVLSAIHGARPLIIVGDAVTTDHIAPAGNIPIESPAGQYLIAAGVAPEDFNNYAARRCSHDVSTRGTFASVRLRNLMLPGNEQGWMTLHQPSGERMSIFDAAQRYASEGTPLVVLAGAEYGTGSSRDWAAKGPRLLGVVAVIASSFERIHRANLTAMGIFPLELARGQSVESLGLPADMTFDIEPPPSPAPRDEVRVTARGRHGQVTFITLLRADSSMEIDYLLHGGVLPRAARRILQR